MATVATLTVPSTDTDAVLPGMSVLVGIENGVAAWTHSLTIFYKVEHILYILSSDHSPGYLSQKNENMFIQSCAHYWS